jgi:hypothetical protein
MTVLNFPKNPTVGEEYALNGVIYTWDSQKWTASEGGSTVSVEVGDSAPLNPSDGDLWWDSSKESGRLYVFYTDENSSQWVECSPAGGIEDPFWKRTGTTLSPLGPNDGVSVGDGNVELNVDGSITAAGPVGVGTTSPATTFVVEKSDSSGFDAHIVVNNSENGSGVSLVGAGTSFSKAGWPAITDAGIIRSSSSSTNGLAINANKGPLSVWTGTGPNERLQVDDSGDVKIGGLLPSAPNISLNADGSASFAGGGIELSADTTVYAGAFLAGNGNATILGNGSATFAGTVVCVGQGLSSAIDATGLSGDAGASRTWYITTSTGSAYFTGTVTANGNVLTRNVEFQLEADNPSKYYPVTDDNGEVTRVYNGEILDVKETLLTMKAKLTEREDRIETLTTRIIALENLIKGGNS